jgi:hypothetical protein
MLTQCLQQGKSAWLPVYIRGVLPSGSRTCDQFFERRQYSLACHTTKVMKNLLVEALDSPTRDLVDSSERLENGPSI